MDKIEVLKQYFGHTEFRSGQSEIIDNILSGRDVLGIMPTGAGKSVCYQVPAMLLDGITIVISPLISLMKDQVEALVQSGVPAAFINSSLTYSQYLEVFRRASNGAYKIIYVAPERLVTDEFIAFAERSRIAMVTVDEAHCVSQWGQDFRPSYLKITEFISRLSYRPIVSAFTATATAEVRADIAAILRLNDPFVITTGFDRQNLYFEVRRPAKKLEALINILNENKDKCCIVYCLTRKNVEAVCQELEDRGFAATRYHAGLSDAERHTNQDDFIYDRKNIMVATNAFGMGIDKSNVSLVVHYNMPKNLEGYYQEAGRAGRDGEPASCILLYSGQDVVTNKFLIENSGEDNEELDPKLRSELKKRDLDRLSQMTFYSTTTDCLRGFILKYFGERPQHFCGHCSNCCTSFETADITIEAQKIISCVYRVYNLNGRSVGKSTIADILHGSKSEKLARMGYDKLTTYGIMADVPMHRIRAIIDFLVEKNYLGVTSGEYPVLTANANTAAVIKEKLKIEMKLPKERKAAVPKEKEAVAPVDSELLDSLKALRKKLADREGVPAYIIFTDASLRDMCRKLPKDEDEFLGISGVGRKKCELYGKAFLEVINEYAQKAKEEHRWTEKEDEKLRRDYKSGLSIMSMSEAHGRSPDDIRVRLGKLGLIKIRN
ncbi:MAG: DNA helicase RecQ [Oscillospiraceae bacterium]|nr:DNA helicase RecQ [Oscillospiraceae bacterium]